MRGAKHAAENIAVEVWPQAVPSEQRSGDAIRIWERERLTRGKTGSESNSRSRGGGSSYSSGESTHEALVPDLETFRELASRTYQTFEEQKSEWARDIRNLKTGCALLRLVNDAKLYTVDVKRSAPGFLQFDMHTIARKFPRAVEAMDRLVEENFQSDFFVPASRVDAEAEQRMQRVLTGQVELTPSSVIPLNTVKAEDCPLM